jgi:CubicO group peptidase (beta-lactamase class C family)
MKDTGFYAPASKRDRLATAYLTNAATGALEFYDSPEGGQWSWPPAFPSGGGGLVSTIDDYLAFALMMLGQGRYQSHRILSRPSVETMTTDHLTAAQKAISGLLPGDFEAIGWGFGVAVTTRRHDITAPVGSYGWAGGLGTCWRSDPSEDMVTILLTQASWTSPVPPRVVRDFWTAAYQAIDD